VSLGWIKRKKKKKGRYMNQDNEPDYIQKKISLEMSLSPSERELFPPFKTPLFDMVHIK
jgi:hypothetical protein